MANHCGEVRATPEKFTLTFTLARVGRVAVALQALFHKGLAFWYGRRESNPQLKLGKLTFYH